MSSMTVGKLRKKAIPDTTQMAYKGNPKSKINRDKIRLELYDIFISFQMGF